MKQKIIIANPVTYGDWIKLLANIMGIKGKNFQNQRLELAAYALGLEVADVQRLLAEARDLIKEEGYYYFGDEPTMRLQSAIAALLEA